MTERQATALYLASALVLLGLLAWQVRRDDGRSSLAHGVGAVTSPITGAVVWAGDAIRDAWNGYFALVGARRELDDAERRIAALEADRARVDELVRENDRLRALLGLRSVDPFEGGIAASVIGDLSSGPLRRRVLVDKGTKDGVAAGWTATASGAVVGRVIDAHARSSDVMLVVDPDSGVAVRHQLDRYAGVLRGGNDGPARLEYVPRDHAVAVGDPLVTSGLDGLYAPGLLVGRVRRLYDDSPLTWRIEVEVAFDPATLESMLLIRPREADEPPPPPPPDPEPR